MKEPTFGKKYTFYNTSTAINFQAVTSRSKFQTVNVELASKNQDGIVDWDKTKISLQLSEVDLYKVFYCISNNKLLCFESKFHGQSKNKSISLVENGAGACKIQVKEKGSVLYFDLSPGQWFYGKLLIAEQLLGHNLSLDDAKMLMYIPDKITNEKTTFEASPLGQSLNEIKAMLLNLEK